MTKVLIVDDQQESLRLLESALTRHGYSVLSARNGAEALEQARKEVPDLVVSDLLMPVMDGYTLLKHWKGDCAFAHIPFVIYTATFTDADDQHFGENLGADAYIMKPARVADLMERLQRVLEKASASVPLRPALPASPGDVGDATLKYYSERLIRKLEEKTIQLEHANQALQREITQHQQANEQILFNHAILETQQESSLDGMLVVSTEGKVLSYNKRFLDLWGVSPGLLEECRVTPLAQSAGVLAEIEKQLEDPARFLDKVRYLHRHREETSLEEVRTTHGKILDVYSAPAIGADDRHYGRIWYYRDVTEARRVQAALEASVSEQLALTRMLEVEHARLVAAQHIANVGSWEIDLTNMTVTWSDVMHRIFETDSAAYKPSPAAFLAFAHPDDRPELERLFQASLAHMDDNRMQHRLLLPGNRVKTVEANWRAFPDEHGRPTRVLGTCLDITDYKLLLDSLHEKAVQLSNAQRIGRMGSWSSDARTGRLTWTEATCELFGIGIDDFRGTLEHLRSFIVPEDLPAFDNGYRKVTPENPMMEMEYRIRRPDGGVRWIYARGNVEFDAHGAPVSRAGMVMDITEQRLAREQLALNNALLRMAGRLSRMGGWSIDTRTGNVFWSEETCLLHEVPVGHKPSLDEVFAFYPAESRQLFEEAFAHCRDNGTAFDIELQLVTATDNRLFVRVSGEAWNSVDDHARLVQGAIQDISAQKAAEEKIHGLGNRLIETLESITDGFITLDTDWNFTYINGRAERFLQRDRRGLLGRNIWEEFKGLEGTALERNYRKVAAEGQSLAFEEYYAPLKSWFEISVYPAQTGLAIYFHDITRRRETEAQLAYLHRVRAALSDINALIVRVGDRAELFREACRIAYESGEFRMAMLCIVDPATGRIEPVATEGKDDALVELVRTTLSSAALAPTTMVAQAIGSREAVVCNDLTVDAPDVLYRGRYLDRDVRSLAVLPLNVHDKPLGVLALYAKEIGFFQDDEMSLLTEMADDIAFAADHIEKKERLDYLANFDTLTGLANRALFLERLRGCIDVAARNDSRLCVALVDLARFKNINDTLGRGSGDVLLQLVAEWLIRNAGGPDHVARIGADQFAVAFVIKPQGDLNRLFESINRTLEECNFRVNDTTLRIAARSGVALYPDDGMDADVLLRNAEAALKQAKTSNERYKFYTRSMNLQASSRLAMENLLRQAVGNSEFELYYQPKANLMTGQVTGAEALIRWHGPHGLVLPGEFMPVLEETGMIVDVGHWALRTAVADYLQWRRKGLPAVRVAVNVSPLQLNNRNFIAELQRDASLDPLSTAGLELEITESVLMADIEVSTARLKALRGMGITVAIDDFGTGFSSLGYLAKLPVDTLKIDRSFIVGMTGGPEGLALVSTIISLAHALNLKVVAEGVENEEQKRLLRLLKCDEMQGFVLSAPLPAAEFEKQFLRGSDS